MARICGKNSPGCGTAGLGWRAVASLCLAWSSAGLVMAAAGEGKPPEEKGLIENGSFEAIERLAAQLPQGIGVAWTGLSYEERQTGDQAPLLYALSLLVVFLCLAALYESWSIPFSVMLIVPLGIFGALLASITRGLSNDVYFQVALLATVGLSAKNAILIVEFAKEQIEQGLGLIEATLAAVRLY